MTLIILEWVATVICLYAAVLNAFNKISGFYWWIFGNAFLVMWAIPQHYYGIAFLMLVYTIIDIIGIKIWKKNIK